MEAAAEVVWVDLRARGGAIGAEMDAQAEQGGPPRPRRSLAEFARHAIAAGWTSAPAEEPQGGPEISTWEGVDLRARGGAHGPRLNRIPVTGGPPRPRRSLRARDHPPRALGWTSAPAEEPTSPCRQAYRLWVDLRARGGAPDDRQGPEVPEGGPPRPRRSRRAAPGRCGLRGWTSAPAEEPAPARR